MEWNMSLRDESLDLERPRFCRIDNVFRRVVFVVNSGMSVYTWDARGSSDFSCESNPFIDIVSSA